MSDLDPQSRQPSEATNWSVWRTDDTGNTFVVRENLTCAEAEQLVAEFEARGHKQTYWAEQRRSEEEHGCQAS
jgi:hypothetical protein